MRALRMLRSLWRQEFGQGLVLAVLAMVVVLGFAAMAIDVGLFLHEKRELQNAADAAALAGVQELPYSSDEAEAMAQEWAVKNGVNLAEGELEPIQVTKTYADDDTITVRVQRDVPYIFARVLGFTSGTMHATGVARVGSPTIATGAVPWALRETYKEIAEAAGYGLPVVLMESSKEGASGKFGALCFDGAHCGSSEYQDVIVEGAQIELGVSDYMKTGVMPVPTKKALADRFAGESTECDTFDEVFNQVGGNDWEFSSNTCNPWTDQGSGSRRVVLAPVIEDHYYDACSGSCLVQAHGFAMLFLEAPSACVTPLHPTTPLVCARFLRASFDIGFLIGAYDPDSDLRFVRLVG